jgi:SAM-dependent methyltransferase
MLDLAAWSERARLHGRRAVHVAIPPDQFDSVTAEQWGIMAPMLTKHFHRIKPESPCILDFGCGAGRFSAKLATLYWCWTVAYDPCAALLALAPVEISVIARPTLPKWRFDLVWCVNVLGGLAGSVLTDACTDIAGAMAPDGMLFLAENTSEENKGTNDWHFRPITEYQRMFSAVGLTLERIGSFVSFGPETSVFAGRQA